MRCLFVAVGLNALFIVLPHWDNIGQHANPPSHTILTPGRPVMFCGSYFMLSGTQAATTTISNVFGMTLVDPAPTRNQTHNALGQSWVPPIIAFFNQQGLLRAYSPPGSPHPQPPQGDIISWVTLCHEYGPNVLYLYLFLLHKSNVLVFVLYTGMVMKTGVIQDLTKKN